MCRDVYVTVTLDDKSLPISQKADAAIVLYES